VQGSFAWASERSVVTARGGRPPEITTNVSFAAGCTSVLLLSGWPDLNRRPLDPQSSALTKLRHSPSCHSPFVSDLDERSPYSSSRNGFMAVRAVRSWHLAVDGRGSGVVKGIDPSLCSGRPPKRRGTESGAQQGRRCIRLLHRYQRGSNESTHRTR
jgi:hypothetical protein